MGDAPDLTLESPKQIGDAVGQTHARLDRVIQEQIRHATASVKLEAGQRELVTRMHRVMDELRGVNARIDRLLTGPLCAHGGA